MGHSSGTCSSGKGYSRNNHQQWGLCLSRSVKVDAPSDVGWQVVHSYPQGLSSVTSIELDGVPRLPYDSNNLKLPLHVGSVVTATREYSTSKSRNKKGAKTVRDTSTLRVVHIDDSHEPKVIKVSGTWWGSMRTSTVLVSQEEDGSCTIQFSLAVIPNSLWAKLRVAYLNKKLFKQLCKAIIEGDLQDWKRFADCRALAVKQ